VERCSKGSPRLANETAVKCAEANEAIIILSNSAFIS
jgi:hypothetical protein